MPTLSKIKKAQRIRVYTAVQFKWVKLSIVSYTEYKNTLWGQNTCTITASHFGQIMNGLFQSS